jgi:hypothetical protein
MDWGSSEFLRYYTTYGVRQVLNINPATVLVGYLMHRLGNDNEFKISVFMGNDNPFAILWTLLAARLFSREDGRTSLIGFNLSNSADHGTLSGGPAEALSSAGPPWNRPCRLPNRRNATALPISPPPLSLLPACRRPKPSSSCCKNRT